MYQSVIFSFAQLNSRRNPDSTEKPMLMSSADVSVKNNNRLKLC